MALLNLGLRLSRSPFRVFVHPSQAVEALLCAHGLQRRFYRQTALWQVAVYAAPA
jgi:hypothetical protein